tara:strand:- start:2837 stop:2992 length:156 start_codon:yes stop_codon:yes gene_type:complete
MDKTSDNNSKKNELTREQWKILNDKLDEIQKRLDKMCDACDDAESRDRIKQ